MPYGYRREDGKFIKSSIPNLTWAQIHKENPSMPVGFSEKQNPKPICNICSINHRLQYKRPPNAEITSDSHDYLYCEYTDQYIKSSEYQEEDIETQDAIALSELKDYFRK
jgi:hypothetical protein